MKRFHHDNRVRAQAQAVFEEWSIVARQATSASADADASVAAANEPAPSPSLASSSSSAAAAATPTRRGSGHSSYKQGAVSVSAAAEAPQSPPLVQRSTGGVETGGATPLFVQLQQYEDDLMKSVGWNGHSLDAALVTSQEEQNGSSALARTQKVGNARLIHLAFFISVLFSILSILMTTIDSHYIRIQLQMESFLFATIAGSKRPMAVRRHFIATRFHRWPALSGPAPCFRAKSPCRKSPLAGGFACTC